MRRIEGEVLFVGDHSYYRIHKWLIYHFGNPKDCTSCGISGEKTGRKWNIEWALKKGEVYARTREAFIGLCRRCHRVYDNTPEWRESMSISAKKTCREFVCRSPPLRRNKADY